MAKKIFDVSTIESWEIELESNRPALLKEMDFSAVPEMVSFAPTALNVGMCFRMRARDGREFAFFANPVVAQNMAGTIFAVGLEAGWLNWHGNVVAPLLSHLDA